MPRDKRQYARCFPLKIQRCILCLAATNQPPELECLERRTMKFEEKLAASMRRSWEEHYIDYKVRSAR